jgi:hypothetical protein
MSKLTLSVFTSTQNVRMHDQEIPLLGKEFHLDENGHIIKQSNAILVEGVVESIEINNLHELLDRINNLSPSQAISIGQNKTAINRIVTIEFAKHHPDFRAITRTKEYFEFGASRSIMMLDYDEGKYTMDELRSQLIQLMPDLAHCEMLMIHSSSSCIYKKGDVPPCTIKGGIHTYIIVDQGIHIPQVGERLKYAAWQLGHGYHKITKNGKLLPRSLNRFPSSVKVLRYGSGNLIIGRVARYQHRIRHFQNRKDDSSIILFLKIDCSMSRNRQNLVKHSLSIIQKNFAIVD